MKKIKKKLTSDILVEIHKNLSFHDSDSRGLRYHESLLFDLNIVPATAAAAAAATMYSEVSTDFPGFSLKFH